MKRTTWHIHLLLMLAVGALLTSCSKKDEAPREVVRPVITMVAPEAGAARKRTFSGVARAAVETPLSFRVSGEIEALPAKLGMQIKAGEVVARLDKTDIELQVKQSEAQLAQAEAQREQARAEYERIRQLYEARNVSKSDLDSVQAGFKSAQAQSDAAMKGLELTRQQLQYCTLRAPVDGSIASVSVDAHQTVQAGQAIATLSSGGQVEVEIGLPETLIARVNVGDEADVVFESVAGEVFGAPVSEVGVELTASSTYPVKVKLLKQDSRIRAGMIAEVTLSFASEGADIIYVPAVAVVGVPSGENHMWVYEEGRVAKRQVEVGDLTSEGLQIIGGLKSGERVVIRGVHRLEDGMKVRLLEE